MHYNYFPDEIIELNKELATGYHPKLEERLRAQPGDDMTIERFATIAAYCGVALDGLYTPEQMVEMVGRVFLDRLKERRENPNKLIIVKQLE